MTDRIAFARPLAALLSCLGVTTLRQLPLDSDRQRGGVFRDVVWIPVELCPQHRQRLPQVLFHPLALGEVGKAGVPIRSLADMERLFDKIPLGQVSTSKPNSLAAFPPRIAASSCSGRSWKVSTSRCLV